MQALFIGQTYIDVTFLTDHIPSGDEKHVASEYAVSFGGNAVTAAFCCAKLAVDTSLICSIADDWLGQMFLDMADKYRIRLHGRMVEKSSLSFIMPNGGKRAIVRCRDDLYREPFPDLDVSGFGALHIDGHQPDAALVYARRCREAGILTSLDGGGVRSNTDELMGYIDVAIVSERFCEQMAMSVDEMLIYLRRRGCRIGGVTRGEFGLLYFDKDGKTGTIPALPVPPQRVIDTNGAGDVFHGAYVFSYLANPNGRWAEHFRFATCAAAFKVQRLGNEAGLPTLDDIERIAREFGQEFKQTFDQAGAGPRPARASVAAMRSRR